MTSRSSFMRLLSLIIVGFTVVACSSESSNRVPLGMHIHFRDADGASITKQFDLMAKMNVTWVRVDADWAWVERERGQFDWSVTDKAVDEAEAHKMNVLIVLAFTPSWARTFTDDDESLASHHAPDDLADYANFTRLAAERYAQRGVHNWEIWNEPNSKKFWPPTPNADEYGAAFRAAAPAIRAVDPKATLLIGGLAPKYREPSSDIAPTDYLEQLYKNGTAQLADGVAAHPYSFPSLPMAKDQPADGVFRDLPALHAVMEKHGDAKKKIWITEFGAPTGTGPNAVSDEMQAKILQDARKQVANWDWIGPFIYYELVDGGTDLNEIEENFGVLRKDLSPKPAANVLTGQTTQ